MLLQQNIMELMLLQIKCKIIFNKNIFIVAIFFLLSISISDIESQTLNVNVLELDTNVIDTFQILQQNDVISLDTLTDTLDQNNKLSFYELYVEPIVAIFSAALITILLFSIRSKK